MQPDADLQALLGQVAALRERVDRQGRELVEVRADLAGLRSQRPSLGSSSSAVPPGAAAPTTGLPDSTRAEGPGRPEPSATGSGPVNASSTRAEKVRLFRRLFAGRGDGWARRWENRNTGTSGWGPVHAGTWAAPKDQRQFLPLTDAVVEAHLAGRDTVGLYPLLLDDACGLLVCDFDASTWRLDVQAYVDAAAQAGVPTAVEVSRSGDGAHVWTFFTAPVSATAARALGAALLREASTGSIPPAIWTGPRPTRARSRR